MRNKKNGATRIGPKVLHIDTGNGWRGGQQQAVYLHEGLLERGYKSNFFCKENSALMEYFIKHELPFETAGLKSELDLFSAWQIAQYARRHGYNILHLHTAHALSLGLLAKIFYPALKTIGVRRVDFHINKNPLSKLKYNTSKLDRLVCISEAIQKILLKDGIDADKTVVIHSGIDIHKFDSIGIDDNFKQSLGIPTDHLVVGTVAALVDHKDYPTLLKAARRVLDQIENVTFLAAGSGDKEQEIKSLASKLSLKSKFHFLGYSNDIGKILKSFDIFVMASKEEGLCTSILDAQSVGLPVVATDAGGIPEIVQDGKNGLLVPKNKPELLAKTILKLISDKDLRKKYGGEAEKSVKKFDIAFTIEQNIKLYKALLKE
ncbi:MAG: glycosyltransferase [Candidatus Marinimicrobia bacterium]|nr:glycosyltransferase [Candidatus Neomarinimicrobiota bacterium]